MIRFIIAVLACVGLFCLAQARPGPDSNYNKSVGSVAFSGILDVVGGANGCWSLRACSAAARGTAAVNVCNSTGGVDVGCADLSTNATTGNLVPATVSGITCPGANCTIKIWYDQSGGNACSAAACNFIQNTVANRATLAASCLGSLPCAQFVKVSNQSYSINSPSFGTSAHPATVNMVANRTGTTGSLQGVFDIGSGFEAVFNTANTIGIYAGTAVTTGSGADSSWHSVTGVINGASSSVNIDNTTTSPLNPGSLGAAAAVSFLGTDHFAQAYDGNFVEGALWLSLNMSGANQTAICHNQFLYWGTSTSC